MKPLVVVTGPDKKLRFGWWATRFMLWLVGLKGYYLTASNPVIPKGVKGIVIGGGDDIEPGHYGLTGDAGASYDPERDALEMRMARHALKCGIPMMGICRGAQLINVVLGGSLFVDIRKQRKKTPNRNSVFAIKHAFIVSQSYLSEIIEKPVIPINSLHNQAIDRVAENLVVSSRDEDGFVQSVESLSISDNHDTPRSSAKNSIGFVFGVQWHPEYMPYSSSQRRLFKVFAERVNESESTLTCEIAGALG